MGDGNLLSRIFKARPAKDVLWWGGIFTSLATATGMVIVVSGLYTPTSLGYVILAGASLLAPSVLVLVHAENRREQDRLSKIQENHAIDHSQLHALLNSMTMGILSVDANGEVRMYNAAFLGLLDTNENLVGQDANKIFHLTTVEGQSIKLMELVKTRHITRREDIIMHYEDGNEIRLGLQVNPVRTNQNQLSGYIFLVEDITKEKSLEEERDEFVSVISHELRTPITICEGSISNAQLLLERGANTNILKKSFLEAHEQIVFLASMVNDLGTLSRAERGVGDNQEEIDLDKLAHELYAKYAPRAEKKQLSFNLDISGRAGKVVASRLYLEEVLQNIITNAIKYTKSGKVSLTIKRQTDGIYFGVKDSGIGISKSDQQKIFTKFYRSEDYRTRETSGTGLGLYVVRKLAGKLGVKISVESRLNHGSTFSFVLPTSSFHLTR